MNTECPFLVRIRLLNAHSLHKHGFREDSETSLYRPSPRRCGAEIARATAPVPLERHAEGKRVSIADLGGDGGQGLAAVLEEVGGERHAVIGEEGDRRFADDFAEAAGELGAGHLVAGELAWDRLIPPWKSRPEARRCQR